MGEKPMGAPVEDEDEPAGASISTTRSNIRSSGAVAEPGGGPAADPIPGLDVKLG